MRARGDAENVTATAASDEMFDDGVESEWSEEYRKWKARSAQAEYYQELDLLMTVEFWANLDEARYQPIINWANEQIAKHGNGSEASYMDAVEESRRRTEAVLRELNEPGQEALREGLLNEVPPATADTDR